MEGWAPKRFSGKGGASYWRYWTEYTKALLDADVLLVRERARRCRRSEPLRGNQRQQELLGRIGPWAGDPPRWCTTALAREIRERVLERLVPHLE